MHHGAPGAASVLTTFALLSPFATYFPEAAAVLMEYSPDTSLERLEDRACLFVYLQQAQLLGIC